MADFPSRLASLRQERQITQQDLARALHVDQSAVSQWETGKKLPSPQTETRIADYFGVSVDYLRGRTNVRNWKTDFIPVGKTRLVPILRTLGVGAPNRADENIEGWEEVLEEDMEGGRDYFFWRVGDDAMEPEVRVGYLVLVREQPWVEDGEMAVVVSRHGEATLKRLFTNGDTTVLKADNPKYAAVIARKDEVHVKGLVVEVRFRPSKAL